MPQIPHCIELHDSKISHIEQNGSALHIYLSPAYIHRDGKGWTQDVEIIVDEAILESDEINYPETLADGHLSTDKGPYHNLLNIPFAVRGPVHLEFELISGKIINIKGNGVSHEFRGEPVFVEEFPGN